MNRKLEILIKTWGVLDLMSIMWYMGFSISRNHMPFVYDIKHQLLSAAPEIGMGKAVVLSLAAFAAYASLFVSGLLLYKLKKAGAVIAFIQCPLRLVTIIPPSVFFLLYPLGFFFTSPNAVVGFSLTLLVELLKITSLIFWWIKTGKSGESRT
jgi:hypothetical protein